MKYIDIHCHLDFPDYGDEITGVLERMKEKGVGAITIGTDLKSSKRAVKIAEDSEKTGNKIWACIGVHPIQNITPPRPTRPPLNLRGGERSEGVILELKKLVSYPKVVAIGECGLDYYRIKDDSEKEVQKKLFIQQIEFALKHNKPLMLHCRNSYDDVLEILERYKKETGGKLRGNAHFFAGTIEQAKRFLDLGFTMSFTGVITFTHDYDEVIKFLPIESMMSETDAPFVAPVPYRGKRNEPSYVVEVVKKLAEIRGEEVEVLGQKLIENAKRVFGLLN